MFYLYQTQLSNVALRIYGLERIFMQTKTSIFSVDFTGTCFKFGCDYILHPIYVDIDTLIKSSITLLNFEKIFNSQAS